MTEEALDPRLDTANEAAAPARAQMTMSQLKSQIDEALERHLDKIEAKYGGIFNRHPTKPRALSGLAMRVGLNWASRQATFTPEQQNALVAALGNSDIQNIIATQPTAPVDADPTQGTGRDWSGFFTAFATFIQAIMPLIMQLVQAFGGLSMKAKALYEAGAGLHPGGGLAGLAMPPAWMLTAIEQLGQAAWPLLKNWIDELIATHAQA